MSHWSEWGWLAAGRCRLAGRLAGLVKLVAVAIARWVQASVVEGGMVEGTEGGEGVGRRD